MAHPAYIKASLVTKRFSYKVAVPPTELQNTDLASLFVLIAVCSAKVLVGSFYLCFRGCYELLY